MRLTFLFKTLETLGFYEGKKNEDLMLLTAVYFSIFGHKDLYHKTSLCIDKNIYCIETTYSFASRLEIPKYRPT